MSNTPKLSRFVWGALRFDSIRTQSIRTTGSQGPWNNDTWTFFVLKTWQQTSVDSFEALYDSTRFARSRSALPEVKVREIMIHEPSSILKRDNKLPSIRLRHFTIRLGSHAVDPHYQNLQRRSRTRVGNYGGFEIIAIRVDSIDSSRIDSCKVESFHRKSIRCMHVLGVWIVAIRIDLHYSSRIVCCKVES